MQLFGEALHISKSGHLVVKSTLAPEQGARVFADKKLIGRVKEVFGPVGSPYVSVGLHENANKDELPGKQLYIGEGKRNG